MTKLLVPIFAFTLASISAFANDQEKIQITHQESCFSGSRSTYEGYVEHGVKQAHQFFGPAAKRFTVASFKQSFKPEHYRDITDKYDCRLLTYSVHGVEVEGYYLALKNPDNNAKRPLVIYNRGGNGEFGKTPIFSILTKTRFLADEGYVVLASQYRKRDEFGGKDVQDVVALVEIATQLPQIDSDNISMYGVSRGGMMTYLAAKQLPQLKSAIIKAGVSDLSQALNNRPAMERVYKHRIPNYLAEKQQQLAKRSALHWIEELNPNIAILLIHGELDKRVNVEHARQMANKLEQLNRPHKLVVYPGGDHQLRKFSSQMNQEIISWMNTKLNKPHS